MSPQLEGRITRLTRNHLLKAALSAVGDYRGLVDTIHLFT